MAEKKNGRDERTNMVFLAGIVESVKMEKESGWFAVNVGAKQWIPCTIYQNEAVMKKLSGLAIGDHVQLKAFVRSWSQKDGEKWKRGLNIEITEVKTIIKGEGKPREERYDDDIPF